MTTDYIEDKLWWTIVTINDKGFNVEMARTAMLPTVCHPDVQPQEKKYPVSVSCRCDIVQEQERLRSLS